MIRGLVAPLSAFLFACAYDGEWVSHWSAARVSERPDDLMDWVNDNTGTGKHLSDLANGATVGRAEGGSVHKAEYYDEFRERRTAEVFANVVAVAGESEFGTALVKRFFPRIYDRAMLIIRQ